MDRVLRAIKIFCAAGKFFIEYSRYALKKKISLSEQEGEMRRRQFFFTEPFFFKKMSFTKKNLLQWRTN